MKEQPLKRRIRYKFMKAIYQRSTLFEMARKAGRFLGSYMIKKFIHGRFSNELDAEQLEAIKEYLSQIILRKGSSEYGFVKMFPYFNRSENAILNHLDEYNELNLEISFYYGTKDWMDTCFNQTKVSQKLKDVGKKVYLIQDAGHHLYFDNPDESCDMILDDFKTGLKTLTSNNQILT